MEKVYSILESPEVSESRWRVCQIRPVLSGNSENRYGFECLLGFATVS